jgi:hypothetical protein
MNIVLRQLVVRTKRSTERVDFGEKVTFIYGPVSTGKSTVARLVDFCFGGSLERTPAIQQEFISVDLSAVLGVHDCIIERGANDTQAVRVTWTSPGEDAQSLNVPLDPQPTPLIGEDVFNLSDLLFHLCGVTPIKVRQRTRDPESPMIRLSFRDIWSFCYLEQTHLDSSFFRLEDPFRGRKSQDAMRFLTGLHSERLSELEIAYTKTLDDQRAKREAVIQIRAFMQRFELGSELDVVAQLEEAQRQLKAAEERRAVLEHTRSASTHPSDPLRQELRQLGAEIEATRQALDDSKESLAEQKALRAEFMTAKTKSERTERASAILDSVHYERCPECASDISTRQPTHHACQLCGSQLVAPEYLSFEGEVLRRDLNDRIDQLADAIARREREMSRLTRQLGRLESDKRERDEQLQRELARYDSAFVESIRAVDREAATLTERLKSLKQLQQLPQAIDDLEKEAGELQGRLDNLRSLIATEKATLQGADANIRAIEQEFKRVMLDVGFPGVSESDHVNLAPQNWRPTVLHGVQEWDFWHAGSGGKKTLFNVCYALALHRVALLTGMPLPSVLIIDSPTKNISDDENPELVRRLYDEIYSLASVSEGGQSIQCVLIDSDLVSPSSPLDGVLERRMSGEENAPRLIPYYVGP